jgi:hypothetical protein
LPRAAYAAEMNRRYDALDAALVAKGFPATSAWWREQVRRYFETDRRQLVLRVGRRGGKSSTLCRVAIVEGLYGGHVIPPGDVGVVAFISVSRDEAAQRLRTIKAILDAIGVKYRPIDGGVELAHRAIALKTFAATLAGVSGFTCICAICDEVAKWADAETGANPATEVLASLRPTLAGQTNARIFLSSSPLGSTDAHATAFDQGDTDFQLVAYAPTWIARPSLTEAETHTLEPDARRWNREYAAIPQLGALGCFDAEEVARAFRERPRLAAMGVLALVIDASSGRKDRFTFGCFGFEQTNPTVLRFTAISGIEPTEARSIGAAGIAQKIAVLGRHLGISTVHGDQRESFALSSSFAAVGMCFVEHTWTSASKPEAVEDVRRWFREDRIHLPKHETMRRELLNFEEKINASGAFTFGARGSGHDDYVSLLITAAMVAREGTIAQRRQASFNRRADDFDQVWDYINAGPAERARIEELERIKDDERMRAVRERTVNNPAWRREQDRLWNERLRASGSPEYVPQDGEQWPPKPEKREPDAGDLRVKEVLARLMAIGK